MEKLVIGLATRGRPVHLVESVMQTMSRVRDPNTLMVVMLDADDAPSIKAMQELDAKLTAEQRSQIVVNISDREETIGEKWNRMCKWDGDVYVAHADHTHHVTDGFDEKILQAASVFPDGIGVVFSHLANASFPSINAATKKWIETVGYYYPPYFPYWFVDHWFDDLARLTDRIAFADIRCDSSRKTQMTQEMREPAWWATWFDAAVLERRQIAFRVIDALVEPDWRKILLKGRYNLVEERSRWVNDNVRQMAPQYELMSKLSLNDARYQRARKKAVDKVNDMLEGMDPTSTAMFLTRLSAHEIPPMKQHYV